MGFLDTIGQRVPESRPHNSRPDIAQRLTRDDAAPGIQTAPAQESPRSDRIHAAVVWSGAVIVVTAVAVAAWLGVRSFATLGAPATEASADAPPAVQTHAEMPVPKRRSVRPRAAVVRSAAKNEDAVDAGVAEAGAETASEASVSTIGPTSHVATVRETEAAPIETMFDPTAAALVAALPEDDYVYSSAGPAARVTRLRPSAAKRVRDANEYARAASLQERDS